MGAWWHRELYAAMYRPAWLMAWPLLFASSTAFLKIDPTMSPRYLAPFPAIADTLFNDPFTGGPRPPPDVLAPGLSRLLTQRAVQQQVHLYSTSKALPPGSFASHYASLPSMKALSAKMRARYYLNPLLLLAPCSCITTDSTWTKPPPRG
jgi:hypothetical protein